jgi:hypothetical protein
MMISWHKYNNLINNFRKCLSIQIKILIKEEKDPEN